MEDKKNLEVVSGDGTNLKISPVYEHLNAENPKASKQKPKNIVVPKEKKKEVTKKEDTDEQD